MKIRIYLLIIISISIIPINVQPQVSKKNVTKSDQKYVVEIFNKNDYRKITPSFVAEKNIKNPNSTISNIPNSPQAWVNIKTEDFEAAFPNEWDVYAATGYTDAYWGKLLLSDNIHYAGYCAASGSQSRTWSQGYADNMRTWMIYGPFDLTDATDAALEFSYFLDCEVDWDTLRWLASSDGSLFYGPVISDSSSVFQWKSESFDLKNVPGLGNVTGLSNIYVAFLFKSDDFNAGRVYNGAIIDNITLKKFIGSSYPLNISINKSFGFDDVTQSSSYRMIGLPGNLDLPLSVQGTQKTDWNAFYDDGSPTNYLVEYTNNSPTFHFKPGNGFWLLSKDAINVNAAVNTVTLAGDNTFSIPVHSGWNIISNPFERSTNWSAVQTSNGLAGNAVIYDWVGTWADPSPTIFSPYKAYYFNNISGLNSLKIPYDPGGTLGKTSDKNISQISGEKDIKLTLLSNGEEKSKAFIGFNSESTNDFDNQDYFAPPGDFEETRIVIRNNNLSTNYKLLMKETRTEIGDGQIYNLETKNLTGQDLTLKIGGLANYRDYVVYLIDERLNNEIKIVEDNELKIHANVKNSSYRFLIGSQQFIDANKANLTPTAFALYQNYPNPFNPTTVIRYSVPRLSNVSIKLFDLLGNEIRILIQEEKSPGNYEFELNAKGIASGVYVYKFQAGSFTQSKKMVLLR